MATLSNELITAANTSGIPEVFREFLIKQELLTPQCVGLLASSEQEVTKEIIDVAIGGSIKLELKDKVAIKLLWRLCRKITDAAAAPSSKKEAIDPDTPLSEEDVKEIKTLWSRFHGFVIPEAWILSPGLVGRISRDVTCTPPKLEIILAESLRPRSCVERTPGTIFQVLQPGKQTETQVVLADAVTRPIELYIRCRAFFVTVAYVSIKSPAFFDFQNALFISDKILTFVTQTFKGQFAPMSFYVAAWAATIHHFSEEIRLHDKTLNECVKNTGEWQHRWSSFTPPEVRGVGQDSNADLPKALQDEMQALRDSVKEWQGKFDITRNELNAYRQASKFQKSTATYGKGGGKNYDKGGKQFGSKGGGGNGKGSGNKRDREYERDNEIRRERSPNRNNKGRR